MRARVLMAVCLTSVLGCTPDFDEVWQVKDLRLLAIAADPPEVLADPAQIVAGKAPLVQISALAADPRRAGQRFSWEALACTADGATCADAKQRQVITSGKTPLSKIVFDFKIGADLLLAAIGADPFKGFGGVPLMIELRIDDPTASDPRAKTVIGVKRLVYGLPDPPEKTPNQNPLLAVVKADGKPIAKVRLKVPPEREIVILPQAEKGARETYWVKTFDGGKRKLDEFLSYSFFVTAGTLSHPRTGGKPSTFFDNKKIKDVTSIWTTPKAPQRGRLWVVIRDDRGGASWRRIDFEVK